MILVGTEHYQRRLPGALPPPVSTDVGYAAFNTMLFLPNLPSISTPSLCR